MPCQPTCSKHAHDPDAVIRQGVHRTKGAKAVFLMASFGPPGSGKSKWNLLMACEVQKAAGLGPIMPEDLKHQLAFDPKHFGEIGKSLPAGKAVLVDEGTGEGAHRMQPTKKENVNVAQELDACRGRGQPVFWANPFRNDLSRAVQQHSTWMNEVGLDHSLEAWECEAPHALFGKGEPYLHKRFKLRAGEMAYLGDYYPELNAEYDRLKALHGKGMDVRQVARFEVKSKRFAQSLERILQASP